MQPRDSQANVWAEMSKVAESEMSPGLFISREGKLTFRGMYSGRTNSGVVISDDGEGQDAKYQLIRAPQSVRQIYNTVSLFRHDEDGILGGVPESAENNTSQGIFGIRELSRQNLQITTDTAGTTLAQSMADFLLETYKGRPQFFDQLRLSGVQIAVRALPDDRKARILGLDLSDELNVEIGQREGYQAHTVAMVVDSINLQITPGSRWDMKLGLSPAWDLPGAGAQSGAIDTAVVDTAEVGI